MDEPPPARILFPRIFPRFSRAIYKRWDKLVGIFTSEILFPAICYLLWIFIFCCTLHRWQTHMNGHEPIKIFTVTTNLWISAGWQQQTELHTSFFMAKKEALNLIICFESKASRVANSAPKGTPCWEYRLRLSCSVQQLKALDEIISPSRLWHSLLLKRALREKRRIEGGKWKEGKQ